MIKDIKFSGYTTAPSDYECPDGSLAASLNVLQEDNALRPIRQPYTMFSVQQGEDVVFVHKVSTGSTYYLLRCISPPSTITLKYATEDFTLIGDIEGMPSRLDALRSGDVRCQAVGNIVTVLLADGSFFHLRFTSSGGVHYRYLDCVCPMLDIRFALAGKSLVRDYDTRVSVSSSSVSETRDIVILSATVSGTGTASTGWVRVDVAPNQRFTVDWHDSMDVSKMRVYVNGSTSWSFELNTQLVVHNHTYDLTPAEQISSICVELVALGGGHITHQITVTTSGEVTTTTSYHLPNTEETYNAVLGAANDYIARCHKDNKFLYPFYVRYAYRMYDGSHIMHSPPVLMIPGLYGNPCVFWHSYVGGVGAKLGVAAYTCSLLYTIGSGEAAVLEMLKTDYKDIIDAIDIYITAPIYSYDMGREFAPSEGGLSCGSPDGRNYSIIMGEGDDTCSIHYNSDIVDGIGTVSEYGQVIGLPLFPEGEYRKKLEEEAVFYHVASLDLEGISADSTFRGLAYEPGFQMDSIRARTTLKDDVYKSHNGHLGRALYSYNRRLMLAKRGDRIFPGFNPSLCNSFSCTGNSMVIAEVNVKTDGGDCIVRTPLSDADDWLLYFFYPDPRAYHAKFRFYGYSASGSGTPQFRRWAEYDVELKEHPNLNGAYWLSDMASPLDTTRLSHSHTSAVPHDHDEMAAYSRDGAMQVYTSETDNPFVFVSAFTVGAGSITGFASAAKALSQGQFGEYPLYAFTTDGVWALSVSDTGLYSARQPITRDVCVNPGSITQLDGAVLFATDRGIMMLVGSHAECITDSIGAEQPFNVLALPHFSELHAIVGHENDTCLPTAPFLAFLSGCGIIYDYVAQRVIVYNPEYTYAYVYSLRSKEWGMMHSDLASRLNSYPDALAMTIDHRLVSFNKNEFTGEAAGDDDAVGCLYVTRPLKLDMPDVLKTIDVP